MGVDCKSRRSGQSSLRKGEKECQHVTETIRADKVDYVYLQCQVPSPY